MKNEKKLTIILSLVVIILLIIMIVYPFCIISKQKKEIKSSVNGIISSANNYFLNNNKEMIFTIKDGNIIEDGLNYDGYLPDSGIIKINKFGEIQIVVNNDLWCAIKSYNESNIDIKSLNSGCEIQNSVKLANVNINIVTDGDGLYADSNGYYFRGLNPKNYFMINDILFRIVGLDEAGNIKIITNDSLFNKKWNENNTLTNGFEILNNNNLAYFLNTNTTDNKDFEKIKKESHTLEYSWDISKLDFQDEIMFNELKQKILTGKSVESIIALPSIVDYIGASLDDNCFLNSINNDSCGNNNYLNIGEDFFTMTSSKDMIWAVNKVGKLEQIKTNKAFGVRPMLVISSNVDIIGKGTIDNPYKIVTK